MISQVHAFAAQLRVHGFVHIAGPIDQVEYRWLAETLGEIVNEEVIALRPGAHAYVAKPGLVPFHTDHPEVDIISWWCEQQDEVAGASLLLDARPIIEALTGEQCELLRTVELWCPPLAGGPPTLRFPVLRPIQGSDAVFCSPWLRSANAIPEHEEVLDYFRQRVSVAAKTSPVCVRLAPGDALFIDNQRMLHGRRGIGEMSRRRLHRLWISRHDRRSGGPQ